MVTEEMIKKEFIHRTVSRDIRRIYATQEAVIREALIPRTGNLLDCISRRPIDVQGSGLKPTYYMTVLRYMRLLEIQYRNQDMKTRRKLALYNRVIWGVLYHETLSTLRYGLTYEIKQSIREDLNESSPKNLD